MSTYICKSQHGHLESSGIEYLDISNNDDYHPRDNPWARGGSFLIIHIPYSPHHRT